jgi:hypothetical protein
MSWVKYPTPLKGSIIGGLIGIIGSILHPFLWTMNSNPLFIFSFIGDLLSFGGIFGCDYKRDSCIYEFLLGNVFTIIVFALIGTLIGFIIYKIKSEKY